MSCSHKSCPVKHARWVIFTKPEGTYGQRWRPARVRFGWWCKSHATEKARCFNHEERIHQKTTSLETFLDIIGDTYRETDPDKSPSEVPI